MTINYFFHYYKIILFTFFTVDNNQVMMVNTLETIITTTQYNLRLYLYVKINQGAMSKSFLQYYVRNSRLYRK